jgi:hypothetical protein
MHILPTNYPNFPEHDKQVWNNIQTWFTELGAKYGVSITEYPDLQHFEMLAKHSEYVLWKSLSIKFSAFNFKLLITEYSVGYYKDIKRKNLESDYKSEHLYFWGYLQLKESYGRVLIRPETLKDKIEEFFEPVELDFKQNTAFSKKYFVIAANKKDFKQKVDDKPQLLEVLYNHPNTYLEFNNNACLFMNFKAVSYKNLIYTINLGILLDQVLNEKSI